MKTLQLFSVFKAVNFVATVAMTKNKHLFNAVKISKNVPVFSHRDGCQRRLNLQYRKKLQTFHMPALINKFPSQTKCDARENYYFIECMKSPSLDNVEIEPIQVNNATKKCKRSPISTYPEMEISCTL